jgi:hypothetical protein
MSIAFHQVGQVCRAMRDIPLVKNVHVTLLTHGPSVLPKGTEAEITAITRDHIELNCKDGTGVSPAAWGLRIKVAKVVFGISFE